MRKAGSPAEGPLVFWSSTVPPDSSSTRDARKAPGSKNKKNMLLNYLKSDSPGAKAQRHTGAARPKPKKQPEDLNSGGAKPPELEIAETMLNV